MVDDGVAVDQHLAIVEHQCRDAAQRIGQPHLGAVAAEARKVALLEGHAVELERDRDAARVGGTVDADELHAGANRSTFPSPG